MEKNLHLDKQPILSICIPTYNRVNYLKECLDSIVCQFRDKNIYDQVEIVISDNASEDTTQELVREYQKNWDNIKYFRNNQNIGFDRNVLKAVDIAQGEYCWLLGDDDALFENALKTIIDKITLYGCSYYICNLWGFDHELRNKAVRKPNFNVVRDQKYNTLYNFVHSIKNHKNIIGYFSGLSHQIFKRKLWNLFSGKEKFINSQSIFSYILLTIMRYESFCLISEALVKTRSGNIRWETFGMSSLKKRLKVTREAVLWIFNLYDIKFSMFGLNLFFIKEYISHSSISFVRKYVTSQ